MVYNFERLAINPNLGMAYYRIGDIQSAVHSFQAALNSKEASQLADKTVIKELQEKGVDNFIAEFNQRNKKIYPFH